MKKVLTELNSLDLYPKFAKHDISTEDHVMNLDITRLNIMGVTVGRGDQFLKEVKQRKRDLLKKALETINSSDLYATLVGKGSYSGTTQIASAHDLDISGQPAGTTMRWKVETLNQSAGVKETRINGMSLGWS